MILAPLFEKRASVTASAHPSSDISWIAGRPDTYAGVQVTPDNALGVAAVFAAVRVGAESIGSLSIDLFKRLDNGGKDTERSHPASWLIREAPNPEISSFIFRETLQGFVETWGNAYAEIEITKGGEPMSLVQRRPDRVEMTRKGQQLIYEVAPANGGRPRDVPADRMLHIPAFGGSGLKGLSPVEVLRETVGRNMAHGRYRSAFFGNGMNLGGIVKHPTDLTPDGKEEILSALAEMHKLPGNAFRAAVFDEGMDWKELGFANDAAQMIETGLYELTDVARAWRIPPHLLMELTHATFTNIEHQDLEFVKYSIMPRSQRWVGELNRKLLTVAERKAGLFFEFNLDTFLRGDFETRQAGFSAAVGSGRMTPNEARAMDNQNPIDGGDATYVPLNWREVGAPAPEPKSVTERTLPDGTREVTTSFVEWAGGDPVRPGAFQEDPFECRATVRDLPPHSQRSAESRWRLRDIFEGLLATSATRILTKEINAIRKQVERIPTSGTSAFSLWLDTFFKDHARWASEIASPVLFAMFEAMSAEALLEVGGDEADFQTDLETFHGEYVRHFGTQHVAISRGQIDKTLREAGDSEEETVAGLTSLLDHWGGVRAGELATSVATDGMGAVSTAAYIFSGVTLLRWVWQGGDCKICPNLHGKVVAIGTRFVTKGESIGDPDKVTPLIVRKVRRYPGLHRKCRCTVAPG